MIPIVHFQYMGDEGVVAEKLIKSGKPFIASLVPNLFDRSMKTENEKNIHDRIHPEENYYPDWAVDFFKQNSNNQKIVWVQEGYRHCCGSCFDEFEENGGRDGNGWPDPFHEHVCLNGTAQSLDKQIEVIGKGKELLARFGISPIGYCPPNHLHDENTLTAARRHDFKYFMVRNGFEYAESKIFLPMYEDKGITIVPESRSLRNSSSVAAYYDCLSGDGLDSFLELLRDSTSITSLKITEKPKIKAMMSDVIIKGYKRARDFENKIKA